jgi:hypothetical protein
MWNGPPGLLGWAFRPRNFMENIARLSGASMISTCQEKKHFSLHSPEGFEARG